MSITDDPELAALQRLLDTEAARRRVAGVTKDPVAQVAELRAEVERLRTIIAGRPTPPTNAEIASHHASGGMWLVHTGKTTSHIMLPSRGYLGDAQGAASWATMYRSGEWIGDPLCWWPLDATGRPCAWPEVLTCPADHGPRGAR